MKSTQYEATEVSDILIVKKIHSKTIQNGKKYLIQL